MRIASRESDLPIIRCLTDEALSQCRTNLTNEILSTTPIVLDKRDEKRLELLSDILTEEAKRHMRRQ